MCSKASTLRGVAGVLTLFTCIIFSCIASCPKKSETQPFGVNQIVGNWYMIAATPTSGNSVSKCAYFNITSRSVDSFHINFGAISRRSHKRVTFFANVSLDEDNNGLWMIEGGTRQLGPFKHRIIAIENRKYVVMVVCGSYNPDLPLHEFSVILAPEKKLPLETLTELKKKLSVYFSCDKILDVEHDVCTY